MKRSTWDDVPIIRREMQSFLKVLLMLKRPVNILEVGTAVGFSALLMSESVPAGCRITTIENYEKRIPVAGEFPPRREREQITLIEGDAADVLKTLEGLMTLYLWMRQRTVYPLPAGDPASAPAGRLSGVG